MSQLLTINSVVNAFRLAECFCGPHAEFTLTELAKRLQLSMGAAQRITHTLTSLGYLRKNAKTKTYQLSAKWLSIGFAFLNHSELREITLPYLKQLNEETNETVSLAVLDGDEVLFVERVLTSRLITTNIKPGARRPLYVNSIGKVILAFLPDREREVVLNRIMSRDAATKGIIKRPEFDRELSKIRELGYVENFTEHLASYAVPLFKYDGEVVAGINICIPKARAFMSTIYKEYLPSLIDKGRRISSELGYTGESV